MNEFKDFAGNVLGKGDFIVYGSKAGSSIYMYFAKVLGARTKKLTHAHFLYPSGFQTKLAIQGCSWFPDDNGAHLAELTGKSQLERSEGVFQIDRSQVPVEVQKLLDGIPVDKN